MVAEADDQLMETFFADGTLSQEQLTAGLRSATLAGKLFPLVCTSGMHAIGIQPLLDAIVELRAESCRARFPRRRRRGPRDVRRRVGHSALFGFRVEDHRGSLRRPHHDAARRDRAR